MNFSNVKDWTIYEGSVIKVTDSLNRVIWEKNTQPTPERTYFYVENLTNETDTLTIRKDHANADNIEVYKSTDGSTWTSMGNTTVNGITATIPANSKLFLKANTTRWGYNSEVHRNYINVTGAHAFGGNILSLLWGDDFQQHNTFPNGSKNNFEHIFSGDTDLLYSNNLVLPPTTLTQGCYWGMFNGCTSLTTAPALPATTLASGCYYLMFRGCTSLTTAPVLPATTLTSMCYYEMFRDCSNLNSVTTYAQDISASSCLYNWLNNVAATGDFYNLGGATYQSGASGIPSGWNIHYTL